MTSVDLGSVHPVAERLRIEAELGRDLADGAPLLAGLLTGLKDEPDGSLPQLSWELPRCWHDSILSKEWSLQETQGGSYCLVSPSDLIQR